MTLPLIEVRVSESEMAHQCFSCCAFEKSSDLKRFQVCAKCKKAYYVSPAEEGGGIKLMMDLGQ